MFSKTRKFFFFFKTTNNYPNNYPKNIDFLGFAKPTSLAVSLRGVCEAGAAGGSTQHWKDPPKGCACISEYYRPGLTIQHWTRLCTQRIEKTLMLWPVQTFHKGPHGISGQRNPLTSRFPWKLQTYVHVCRWGPGVPPLQHQYLFNTSTICICTCSVAAMPRQDGEGGAVFSG